MEPTQKTEATKAQPDHFLSLPDAEAVARAYERSDGLTEVLEQRRKRRRDLVSAAYKACRRRNRIWATAKTLLWHGVFTGAGAYWAQELGLSTLGGAGVGFLVAEVLGLHRHLRRETSTAIAATNVGFTVGVSVHPGGHELCKPWIELGKSLADEDAEPMDHPSDLIQSRRFYLPSLQSALGRGLIWDDTTKSAKPGIEIHGLYFGTLDGGDGWKTQPDLCLLLDEGWLELWLTPILDPAAREKARERFPYGANTGANERGDAVVPGLFWPTGARRPRLIAEYPLATVLSDLVVGEAERAGESLSDWRARAEALEALRISVGFGPKTTGREAKLPFDRQGAAHMTVTVKQWGGP
jgi:hypothetical protein